ncbi:Pollen Ole e 1 allergen and extensin family protein [Forsythia ovata]|uniref:Pollen Ole e 1 allergen and extensin family protein n=1 Tax=Forsythia ovata TaxID=205694 RepID=A0ABD1T413_9LAMI
MEKYGVVVALFFTLVLSRVYLSTSHVLMGSVICRDCKYNSDLSGIQVVVKCDKAKKLAMATTHKDGTFNAELPSDDSTPPNSLNCLAKILGGPHQLFASRKESISMIVKTKGVNIYATSKPLNFYKSCPLSRNLYNGKCVAKNMEFGSSKTVDLPLPREWGLAPTSYYVPFFPIIGIP